MREVVGFWVAGAMGVGGWGLIVDWEFLGEEAWADFILEQSQR